MKRIVPLALLAACTGEIVDPAPRNCEAAIPADVLIVTGEQAANGGEHAWVCEDGTLSVNAGGGTYFVEADGTLALNAPGAIVYAKHGATVVDNAGGSTVYAEHAAEVHFNAGGGERIACDAVLLDTTAVSDGC